MNKEKLTQSKIGFWTCTSLVMGNMIGSGIFLLPASLAAYGGISIFGWLFTTIGVMFVALVFARLSQIVPKAGGPYAYTRRGFGEFAGFLVAWGYWIAIMAGNAAIAVAMVSYLTVFFPTLSMSKPLAGFTAIASLWVLSWVNISGIKHAGRVQVVTTVLKILPLIALGTIGFLHFNAELLTPFNVSGKSSFDAITATAALTLWAFMGLESGTIPANDVHDPERTMARATIVGVLATSVIYILSTFAVMGIVPTDSLGISEAPFADAATKIWGEWAGKLVAAGAIISCFGALNGWILNQGQIPLAAARDHLFPAVFAKVNKHGAPATAIIMSSVLVTVLIFTNYTRGLVGMFTFVILLSTLTALVPFVFTTIAQLLIFINEPERFSTKQLILHSSFAVLGFLYSMWAIIGSGHEAVYWGFILLLAGFPVYAFLIWRRPIEVTTQKIEKP